MMHFVVNIASRLILLSILATIDFFFLIGSYGVLSVLRIPVNWVTWIIGSLIIAASAALCVSIVIPNSLMLGNGYSNILGVLSFAVAVYTANQWTTRKWYVAIKKRAGAVLVKPSRNVLLFLRKYHLFFGWVVAAAAVAHAVYFLPILTRVSWYEVVTGFVALGILGLSVVLGVSMWVMVSVRKKPMPKIVHTVHAALTIAFFIALVLHV